MAESRPKEVRNCRWCYQEVKACAIVCYHCGRHQGNFWKRLRDEPTLISATMALISVFMACVAFLSLLETRRERIDASTAVEQVKKLANTVVKMGYLLADGARGYGGLSEEHLRKIKEYQKEIKESLDPGIDEEIEKDIEEVKRAIRSAIDKSP